LETTFLRVKVVSEAFSAAKSDSETRIVIKEEDKVRVPRFEKGERVAERGKAVQVWDAFTFGASSHFDPATPYVPGFCEIIDRN
jgi:hypothetical protein